MVLATITMLIELFVIMLMHLEIDNLRTKLQMAESNKRHYKNQIKQLENKIMQMNEKELPSWELDN